MDIQLIDSQQKITVSEQAFAREFNQSLVHQVVTAYLSGARQGTRAQKTRSQVSGGGSKPWRQKGTGRARAGTTRSPLWRKGGVIFAATPQDHSQKINRKMYQGAVRCIFSELIRQHRLLVIEQFTVFSPKTKELVKKLKELSLENVLIITEELDDNLYLSSRNLSNVDVLDVIGVNPVTMMKHDKVLLTVAALKKLEEQLL